MLGNLALFLAIYLIVHIATIGITRTAMMKVVPYEGE